MVRRFTRALCCRENKASESGVRPTAFDARGTRAVAARKAPTIPCAPRWRAGKRQAIQTRDAIFDHDARRVCDFLPVKCEPTKGSSLRATLGASDPTWRIHEVVSYRASASVQVTTALRRSSSFSISSERKRCTSTGVTEAASRANLAARALSPGFSRQRRPRSSSS